MNTHPPHPLRPRHQEFAIDNATTERGWSSAALSLTGLVALALALLSCAEGHATDGVDIERAFPKMRFDRPVFLTGAGDGSGRVFVVEQAGVIHVFSKDNQSNDSSASSTSSKVFLDISDQVSRRGNEEGLLGLAFHPQYEENGLFFVHYSSSVKNKVGVVSRFEVSADDPDRADPNTEQVILEQPQPHRNHNGGMIAFGPDDFLYIAFGDGGSANDPYGNGQDVSTWLAALLRIDVDNQDPGKAYAVPPDNPFVTGDVASRARPELWAIGLRNVWRFSFDRRTGELWAGDVGQVTWEEIDIIHRGGNYGWNRYEGDSVFDEDTDLAIPDYVPPIAVHGRREAWSITGGYVYRGREFPSLQGAYFYGDYIKGNLWMLTRDADDQASIELVRQTGRSISSFGEDDDGELYLLSFDGGIYQIVPTHREHQAFSDWPARLSETGLFASTRDYRVAPNVIPYEVNAPFWSDGASKTRFIALPEGTSLTLIEEGAWEVPVGTTLIKSFAPLQGNEPKLLETRLIRRTSNGWEGATYIWNGKETDATFSPAGRQIELWNSGDEKWNTTIWHAPSASECNTCHIEAQGYALGLTTAQLNRKAADNDVNQIEAWSARGILSLPKGFMLADAVRLPDPFGEDAMDTRARAWLDVNCAMCHQPEGTGDSTIDLRYTTKLPETKMIDEPSAQGAIGASGDRIISPGHPDRSVLLQRVESLGQGRMPPVGSLQVDRAAVELLREWISSMDSDGGMEGN